MTRPCWSSDGLSEGTCRPNIMGPLVLVKSPGPNSVYTHMLKITNTHLELKNKNIYPIHPLDSFSCLIKSENLLENATLGLSLFLGP